MPLDIGAGIFGAIIASRATVLSLNWQLIVGSILFTLLPDADLHFVIHFFAGKPIGDKFSHEHRDLFHKPIPYVVIGFLIILIWNPTLACLFAALSCFHFLHDSVDGGWGIRWFYPFSNKYYKFFSGKDGKWSKNFIASWTPEEQKQAAAEFGDPDWAKHYLQSPEFLIEILVFLIAVGTLAMLLR